MGSFRNQSTSPNGLVKRTVGYIVREKDEDAVAKKEETGKAKMEVYGRGERGHG